MPDEITQTEGEEVTTGSTLLTEEVDEGNEPSTTEETPEDSQGTEETPTEPAELTLKAPEGFDELDETLTNEFIPIAKELKLTSEQAQKVVDLYGKGITSLQEGAQKQWDDQVGAWREETMKDEDIGGAKFEETRSNARRAIDTFGNDGFKKIVDQSGLGNNVEFIRFIAKIGSAIKDADFHFGKDTAPVPKTHAQLMFPDLN